MHERKYIQIDWRPAARDPTYSSDFAAANEASAVLSEIQRILVVSLSIACAANLILFALGVG